MRSWEEEEESRQQRCTAGAAAQAQQAQQRSNPQSGAGKQAEEVEEAQQEIFWVPEDAHESRCVSGERSGWVSEQLQLYRAEALFWDHRTRTGKLLQKWCNHVRHLKRQLKQAKPKQVARLSLKLPTPRSVRLFAQYVCKRVAAELFVEDQRHREAMLSVICRLLFHRLSLYYQSYSHDGAKVRLMDKKFVAQATAMSKWRAKELGVPDSFLPGPTLRVAAGNAALLAVTAAAAACWAEAKAAAAVKRHCASTSAPEVRRIELEQQQQQRLRRHQRDQCRGALGSSIGSMSSTGRGGLSAMMAAGDPKNESGPMSGVEGMSAFGVAVTEHNAFREDRADGACKRHSISAPGGDSLVKSPSKGNLEAAGKAAKAVVMDEPRVPATPTRAGSIARVHADRYLESPHSWRMKFVKQRQMQQRMQQTRQPFLASPESEKVLPLATEQATEVTEGAEGGVASGGSAEGEPDSMLRQREAMLRQRLSSTNSLDAYEERSKERVTKHATKVAAVVNSLPAHCQWLCCDVRPYTPISPPDPTAVATMIQSWRQRPLRALGQFYYRSGDGVSAGGAVSNQGAPSKAKSEVRFPTDMFPTDMSDEFDDGAGVHGGGTERFFPLSTICIGEMQLCLTPQRMIAAMMHAIRVLHQEAKEAFDKQHYRHASKFKVGRCGCGLGKRSYSCICCYRL
jgi:hypothetical protein